jgi:multisubunit Na+/H+ antiporter MnhG subunit
MKRNNLTLITVIVVASLPLAVALYSPLCFAVFLFGSPVVAFAWGRATAAVQVQLIDRSKVPNLVKEA